MTHKQQLSLAHQLFRLGGHATELLFWVEQAWCDDETGENAATLGRVEIQVRDIERIVEEIEVDALPERKRAGLEGLPTRARKFYAKFKSEWLGEDRSQRVRSLNAVDPEYLYDCHKELISSSPLKDPLWLSWEAALAHLHDLFLKERYVHASFAVGRMLARVSHPTHTIDTYAPTSPEMQAYLAVDFNADLATYMRELVKAFPFFRALDHDLSQYAGEGISRAIGKLQDEIAAAFLNPQKLQEPLVPGYLGLILDESHGLVRRGRKEVTLDGPLIWSVLKRLAQSGTERTSREGLNVVLEENRRGTNSRGDESLDQHLKILRRVLKPLGVGVPGRRGNGWMLEELKGPKKDYRRRQ